MAVLFTAADLDAIYADTSPTTDLTTAFGIGFLFRIPDNGAGLQTVAWIGDKDAAAQHINIGINAAGTMQVWCRPLAAQNTTATVRVDQTNVGFVWVDQYDPGGGEVVRIRIKINGSAAETFEVAVGIFNDGSFDRIGFGASLDSSASNYLDGYIEYAWTQSGYDSFAGQIAVWNGGAIRSPATAGLLTATHLWAFNDYTGVVNVLDTEVQDSIGTLHMTTLSGTPAYDLHLVPTTTVPTITATEEGEAIMLRWAIQREIAGERPFRETYSTLALAIGQTFEVQRATQSDFSDAVTLTAQMPHAESQSYNCMFTGGAQVTNPVLEDQEFFGSETFIDLNPQASAYYRVRQNTYASGSLTSSGAWTETAEVTYAGTNEPTLPSGVFT